MGGGSLSLANHPLRHKQTHSRIMTRSKTFWSLAALICLGVAVFSGYSLYARVSLHFSGDTVEIKPPPPLPPSEEEEAEPETPREEPKAEEKAPAEEKKPAEGARNRAVKTSFEYKDAKAKAVSIAGSFTSWRDVRMKKKDGVWKTDVYILPGTYPYHFTVDGKKKKDPGKPVAPATGDSLVMVAAP